MTTNLEATPAPLILDAPNQQEVFGYYYHGSDPIYPLPAGLGGDDAATRAAIANLGELLS